jgi:hypothetical protein
VPWSRTEREDAADLAPGVVLHSAPGQPAFPVRLALELFRRAQADLGRERITLWDPCCGSGYLATVLGLLERGSLERVLASDVSDDALGLARRNLRLLDPDGLSERADERRRGARELGKPRYDDFAASADRLRQGLVDAGGALPTAVGAADAFDAGSLGAFLGGDAPDLVLTDVPYGERVTWAGAAPATDRVPALLATLGAVLPTHAAVVVCDRSRKVDTGGLRCAWRFRVGTRAAAMVRVADIRG